MGSRGDLESAGPPGRVDDRPGTRRASADAWRVAEDRLLASVLLASSCRGSIRRFWLPENAAALRASRAIAGLSLGLSMPAAPSTLRCAAAGAQAKMRYLEILASYVPQVVVRHLLDSPDAPTPSRKTLETVCMFCDVSGFTRLTDAFGNYSGEGAEGLKKTLNSYFGQLNRIVAGHGDIFKFAGDAVMVLWRPAEPLQLIARRAARCALEVQAALHSDSEDSLSVKIGLGVGQAATAHGWE